MTIDEFEPDDVLAEINHKLANISLYKFADGEVIEKSALETIKQYLHSSNEKECLQSVQALRKYLTQENDPSHTDDIISLGVLPRLKEILLKENQHAQQFECAWIITNIAAGSSHQTTTLVKSGFITALLECLYSKTTTISVKAQAAWALSNFAGESATLRERLVTENALVAVAGVLREVCDEVYDEAVEWSRTSGKMKIRNSELSTDVKALTWALSNMSRGGFRTAEYWEMYLPAFDALANCIVFDHQDIWIDACWGLSRILYNMHEVTPFYRSLHLPSKLCMRLAHILTNPNISVVVPALRTVINVTSGPNEHSDILLNSPILGSLARLMPADIPIPIRRDSFLVVANLAASNEGLVKRVIDDDSIMRCVIAHIHVPGHVYTEDTNYWVPTVSNAYYNLTEEWKITTEALWIMCNLTTQASDSKIRALLENHADIPGRLASLLDFDDLPLNTCTKTVDAIINIVGRSNKLFEKKKPLDTRAANPYIQEIISSNIEAALERLCRTYNHSEELKERCTTLNNSLQEVKRPAASMAAMFGMEVPRNMTTGASKRRVLRGLEDGDVRLIENAVSILCINPSE